MGRRSGYNTLSSSSSLLLSQYPERSSSSPFLFLFLLRLSKAVSAEEATEEEEVERCEWGETWKKKDKKVETPKKETSPRTPQSCVVSAEAS